MSPAAPPALNELRLRKEAVGWQVVGETVSPFPVTRTPTTSCPRRA